MILKRKLASLGGAAIASTALAVTLGASPASALVGGSGCGGQAYAAPAASWGPTSVGNCAVFGSPGLNKGISWSVIGSGPIVCLQAWSYENSAWYNIGCGGSTGGGVIPWGNVAATPEVRATSNSTGIGVSWWY
jgi:hypothetical protein